MQGEQAQAPYAIRQFETDTLIPLEINGVDISFTTSSQAMVTTVILLTWFLIYGTRKRALVPGRLQAAAEALYSFIASTVVKTAGPEAKQSIPFVFSIFIFIFFGTLIGMMPVKYTFTTQIVVTLSLAMVVFVYVNVLGFRTQGLGLFRMFLPAGTPLYIAPLLVLIEIISYLFRPITLGVRIFANILAGHIMIKLFADMSVMKIQALDAWGFGLIIPSVAMMVVLYGFETMIVAIQSYIFIVLTSLYIRDSLHSH